MTNPPYRLSDMNYINIELWQLLGSLHLVEYRNPARSTVNLR